MNGNHFDIHDLKREYEKGRKQGAIEELKELKYINNLAWLENDGLKSSLEAREYYAEYSSYFEKCIEKRLVELQKELK